MILYVQLRHLAPGADVDDLRAQLPADVQLTLGPPSRLAVDVLVTGTPTAEELDDHPELRALVVPYAGIPRRTMALLRERPTLAAYNLHHNAGPVAEHAVALLLAVTRRVVPMDAALRRFDWRPRYEPDAARRVEGAGALVLGYGAIGRRVAKALVGLGMRVTATRRSATSVSADGPIAVHPASDLDALLPAADAVLVCLPHTPDTDGLLDERRLALLPEHASLVNVARAGIVDEDALFEALVERRLHGAGLDVWYRYPRDESTRDLTPPALRPFHELDNVVLSPHRAGHAHDIEALRTRDLAAVLAALSRDEEAPGRVDVVRGY